MLVAIREFEASQGGVHGSGSKADILLKYSMADAKDLKRNQELPKNVRLNETDLEGLVGKKQKQKNNLELFRGRILIRKTLPPLGTYSVLIFFSCGIRRRRI